MFHYSLDYSLICRDIHFKRDIIMCTAMLEEQ